MKLLGIGVWACALAVSLSASTIDVSGQSTQTIQAGDSLVFLFSGTSYAKCAEGMDMSPYPGSVNFTFASMPVVGSGEFTAALESADGTAFAEFPNPVTWTSGYAQNSGYSGAISAVVETLALTPDLSQELFSGGAAELVLDYSGPAVTLGMSGSDMRQDIAISLVGGPLSIGGMVYSVGLDDDPIVETNATQGSVAPEPGSGRSCSPWAWVSAASRWR